MRLPWRRRPPLRPLEEAEAYARLHGERSEEILRVAPAPPRQPTSEPVRGPLTGESLRQAFERRLRSRRYFK